MCCFPFSDPESQTLKEHLIDELDYVLVPTEAWNKLLNWYGCVEGQQPIVRKVSASIVTPAGQCLNAPWATVISVGFLGYWTYLEVEWRPSNITAAQWLGICPVEGSMGEVHIDYTGYTVMYCLFILTFFFCFVLFCFLGLHSWHIEIPKLGDHLEL